MTLFKELQTLSTIEYKDMYQEIKWQEHRYDHVLFVVEGAST